MFNVGGGELIVIFLVILIVLGPEKLPETARKLGNVVHELRRMSSGLQNEMRAAMDEATRQEQSRPSLEPVEDDEPRPRATDDPAA